MLCEGVNTVSHGTFHCLQLDQERNDVLRAADETAAGLTPSDKWASADDSTRLALSFTPNKLFPASENAWVYRRTLQEWSGYRRAAKRRAIEAEKGSQAEA